MSWNGWTWNDDYSVAYLPTSDPRVLAVIERDTDASAPDGDAYAPAAFFDYRGYGWTHYLPFKGSTYQDDDALDTLARAMNEYGQHDERVARYMRIFHDVGIEEVHSFQHRGDTVYILDTPAHREAMGTPADCPTDDYLRGDVEAWQAYLDGDVYGIGYAVNESRVLDDGEPIDLDEWDVTIECWGFYGDDCAMSEAAGFPYGGPELDPLIPFDIAS